MAAVAVVALVAGTYLVANLIGRSGDPLAGQAVALPGASPAAQLVPGSAEPGPAVEGPAAETAAVEGPVAGELRERQPDGRPDPGGVEPSHGQGVAGPPDEWHLIDQPITGPGQPPLPRSRTGPFGSRRTTGAEYVALTFDDGPDPRYTPQVLELLREYGATATFCVVGQLAEAYPELIRAMVADGHTLCNHSWSHDMALGSRSAAAIRDDMERTNAAIRAAAPGTRVSYYRQPGGNWTDRVVDVAEELGMTSLHWAVDPQDWRKPGAAKIAREVIAGCHAGAIVLLHDGGGERDGTVAALRSFLPDLTGRFVVAAMPPGVDPPRRHGIELPLRGRHKLQPAT
jgi:peptidoglycan-N-acetylglucosamine deacetylase